MRNLIEEAALRLKELQRSGQSDPSLDAFSEVPPLTRTGSAVMPIGAHFVAPPQQAARKIELDFGALAKRGMLTPDSSQSRLASEYRVIKRPLIRNAGVKGSASPRAKFIMVTSAQGGEGKTFTAVNLAMSIAMEMDQSVLLVDADVLHPSLSTLLGLPEVPGLLDVLADTANLADALVRTQIRGLSVLSNGDPNARATELIASDTMRSLLNDLTARDPDLLLIFDAPPLLTSTEARELASHMGQLVIVVEAGRTAQSEVQHALSIVEDVPERMLMLNGVPRRRAGWVYDFSPGFGRQPLASEAARE